MVRSKLVLWMLSAFGAALFLAVLTLAIAGTATQGTNAALAVTGRFSFLLFWSAYTGTALVTVFGNRFRRLQQSGRELGLAFASAHLVHLALVGWLCYIGNIPGRGTFAFFGLAAILLYLLAALSFDKIRLALGFHLWRMIRSVAMNYIALAFAVDFMVRPINGSIGYIIAYLPFSVLIVLGLMLRLIAYAVKRRLTQVKEINLANRTT